MKIKGKVWIRVLVFLLISIALSIAAFAKTITITDYRGRKVTLPYPVERIILLQHHAAWAIRLLGAQDKIVGISKHIPEEGGYSKLSSKPIIGTFFYPNYEKIVELNPQVVITFHPNPGWELVREYERKLEPFGIKVLFLRFTQMRTSQFKTLAKILGKEEKAERFLAWRKSKLNLVEEGLKGLKEKEKIRVYNEPDFKGGWTTRPEMSINFAGGKNIAEKLFPPEAIKESIEVKVDPEWVIKKDPEVVILADWPPHSTGYNIRSTTKALEQLKEFMQRPGMDKTSAAKNHRVYVMNYKLTAGCKAWIGAIYMAKIFYPERFKDLDPERIHKEFYEKWLNMDYQGIHIYPFIKSEK
ncbi:hypothetical protein DRJ00_06830 [Candidatus Aerophobetes bacterium]|uniref:Fe/B12 periplasmic-binding domain-containing protein n=1 Tax=Aerophobetes bacterium TaxID=2030807 RepID=A0A497E2Z7_UNCAE|nr:MAG: hypothetical protein DRJ00_06830 [Candidatus Aerophobetes bacterium]